MIYSNWPRVALSVAVALAMIFRVIFNLLSAMLFRTGVIYLELHEMGLGAC
jgi:hypothetical protein